MSSFQDQLRAGLASTCCRLITWAMKPVSWGAWPGGREAGQLDWWVQDRLEWSVGYAVRTAVNGGSKLLIFDRANNHDLRREPYQPIPGDCSQYRVDAFVSIAQC
jgi:hypothetical protein